MSAAKPTHDTPPFSNTLPKKKPDQKTDDNVSVPSCSPAVAAAVFRAFPFSLKHNRIRVRIFQLNTDKGRAHPRVPYLTSSVEDANAPSIIRSTSPQSYASFPIMANDLDTVSCQLFFPSRWIDREMAISSSDRVKTLVKDVFVKTVKTLPL